MFKVNKLNSKTAFTLVELLVVIAIIGLLATLSVIALQTARAKARDAKRIGDIKQITTALEMYFNDNGRYPEDSEWLSGTIRSGDATYLAIIPSAANPPDGNCNNSSNAFDYSQDEEGASYTVHFCTGGNINSLPAGNLCATPGGLSTCTGGPPCTPQCSNKCGGVSDECGGFCNGTCTLPYTCDLGTGTCNCTPDCSGHNCGDNGCEGSCGTCGEGETCTDGNCVFICGNDLVDTRDSKSYSTIEIGTQCWMAQSLNVGTRVSGSGNQGNFSAGLQKYCYNDSEAVCSSDGGLYQWHMAAGKDQSCDSFNCNASPSDPCCTITGNDICPSGWHLPTDAEYTTLKNYLSVLVGTKLKAAPSTWDGDNSSGFNALPYGWRHLNGAYYGRPINNNLANAYADLWTASPAGTESYYRYLTTDSTSISNFQYDRPVGFSVRCLKD